MKIFLTGSGGMLGRNILSHPESKKYDWLTPKRSELDLLNFTNVNKFIKQEKPDFIIHAAGKVGGINSHLNNQFNFFYENLEIGKNVIIAAKNNDVKKLINISSGSVFPDFGKKELFENDILTGPLNKNTEGYSLAKISILKLCHFINCEHKNFNYKSIIASNLFGFWDKFNKNGHMIPSLIHRIHNAKKNNQIVEIWGDGTAKRQFLYAKDFSKFLFLAISNFEKMESVTNVGFDTDYTVKDYNLMVAKVVGYNLNFKYDLTKPVGNIRKYLNTNKQKFFNFAPDYTMEKAIEETYNHFLKNLHE